MDASNIKKFKQIHQLHFMTLLENLRVSFFIRSKCTNFCLKFKQSWTGGSTTLE